MRAIKSQGIDFMFAFLLSTIVVIGTYIIFIITNAMPSLNYSMNPLLPQLSIEELDNNELLSSTVNIFGGYYLPMYDYLVYLNFYQNKTIGDQNEIQQTYQAIASQIETGLSYYFSNLLLNGVIAGSQLNYQTIFGSVIGYCLSDYPTIQYQTIYGNMTMCGVLVYPLTSIATLNQQ